jgi:hypothetical protein
MIALSPDFENLPVGDHAAPRPIAKRLFGEFLVTQRSDVGHRSYRPRYRESLAPFNVALCELGAV